MQVEGVIHRNNMEEKRKLKYTWHRLPKKKAFISDLVKDVAKETGYPKEKLNIIVRCLFKSMVKNILSGKLVDIEGLGQFYANISPPRKVNDFKNEPDEFGRTLGKKGMKVAQKEVGARWVMKYRTNKALKTGIKAMTPPTKEQLDSIYRD